MDVKLIQHWVGILRMKSSARLVKSRKKLRTHFAQTGSEHYDLVNFTHLLEEIVDSWSLDHIHIVPMVLDLNWYYIVGLLY